MDISLKVLQVSYCIKSIRLPEGTLSILEDHLKEPEEPFWIKGNGYIIKGTTSVLLH